MSALNALFKLQCAIAARAYSLAIRIGEGAAINPPFYFTAPQKIRIGKRCRIYQNVYLSGHGGINIGDDVVIQNNVTIISSQHDYGAKGVALAKAPLMETAPIEIGDGAWLSPGAIILPGSRVGKGCIIGAGSVVTHTLKMEENCIYAGNPARFLKKRFG